MHIQEALSITEVMKEYVREYSEKIEVSGCLRRKRREVGMIDMVIQPKWPRTEFGMPDYSRNPIITYLRGKFANFTKGDNDNARYCQIMTRQGIPANLWFADERNFYWLLFHSTGTEYFVEACYGRNNQNGWKNKHGWPHDILSGDPYQGEFKSEYDVFKFLKIHYIDPWERWGKDNVIPL